MTPAEVAAAGVVAAIDGFAATAPDRVAAIDRGIPVTYAGLAAGSRRAAAWLLRAGIAPGDTVGLTLRDELPHLLACLGLLRLGCRQVTLASHDPPAARAALAATLRPAVVLTGAGLAAPEGIAQLQPDLEAIAADADLDAPPLPAVTEGEIVITSSGTTGRPKLVALPGRLLAEQGRLTERLGAVRFRAFGNEFNNGKRLQLHSLSTGRTEVLANNAASGSLAEVCARFGVQRLNLAPVRAEALMAEAARPGAAPWPAVTGLTLAGGPVPAALRRRLAEALTPEVCVLYGTSETGPLTLAGPADHGLHPDTVGFPLPGVEVEVVDDAGRALPCGEAGQVRVRGPGAATGYLGDPEASARAFRGGWFHTGDVGWLTPGGALVLAGRGDDMMNLGTLKVFPAEIEAAAEGFPGLSACAAFALPAPALGDIPFLAVVTAPGGLDEVALLALLRARLGLRAPRRLLRVDALPRNAQGKVLRRELAALAARDAGLPPRP